MANEPDLAAVLSAFSIAGSGAALKLLDAVRNHSLAEVRDLPVIVISDHPRQSLFAWQAGADEMLVRPVDIDVLTEAVNDVLRRDESARADYRSRSIAQLSRPDSTGSDGRPIFS